MIDPLSDALSMVRLSGALIFRVQIEGPWCVTSAPGLEPFAPALPIGTDQILAFHVVLGGACWARCPPGDWVRARAGEAIVLPHGQVHELGEHRGRSPLPFNALLADRPLLELRELGYKTGDSPQTAILCGFLGCDRRAFSPLFAALPAMFVTRFEAGASGLLGYALEAALGDAPGSGSLRVRMAELLFLESLRGYIRNLPSDATGWLAGLRDPLVSRALRLLHEAPAADWTVERMAERSACSRSVLAERFKSVIGEAPIHYLTRLRMQQAARRLRDGDPSIEAVADEVGYASTAAFQRAFKRCFGQPPAAWRRARRRVER